MVNIWVICELLKEESYLVNFSVDPAGTVEPQVQGSDILITIKSSQTEPAASTFQVRWDTSGAYRPPG